MSVIANHSKHEKCTICTLNKRIICHLPIASICFCGFNTFCTNSNNVRFVAFRRLSIDTISMFSVYYALLQLQFCTHRELYFWFFVFFFSFLSVDSWKNTQFQISCIHFDRVQAILCWSVCKLFIHQRTQKIKSKNKLDKRWNRKREKKIPFENHSAVNMRFSCLGNSFSFVCIWFCFIFWF